MTRLKKQPSTDKGFTLLELSIVTIISGLIIASVFALLNQRNVSRGTQMNATVERILFGISEHYRIYGFYPCPANLLLPLGDPLYGESACSIGTATPLVSGMASAPADPLSGSTSNVLIGGVPTKELNRALGCEKANVAATAANRVDSALALSGYLDGAGQHTRGDIQFTSQSQLFKARDILTRPDIKDAASPINRRASDHTTNCLSDDDSLDIFESKFIYAVSENSTAPPGMGFTPNGSGIHIIDQSGNPAANTGTTHFVLLSTGADRKGAIFSDGAASGVGCGPVTPADELDNENCNFDARFLMMPYSAQEISDVASRSRHYDDRVEFSFIGLEIDQDTWGWQDDATERDIIFNTLPDAAGIGQAGLQIGPDQNAMNTTDKLRISNGGMRSDQAHIFVTDSCDPVVTPGCVSQGGQINIQQNIDVQFPAAPPADYNNANVVVEAEQQVLSDKYCYQPPVTCSCGASCMSIVGSSDVLDCATNTIIPGPCP